MPSQIKIKPAVKKLIVTAILSACCLQSLQAAKIALIIDDVGNNPERGVQALQLDGKIIYGILPGTPHATMLAEMAHARGKEVLVHIPMESEHHKKLGPDGLTLGMQETEYKNTIQAAMQSVPYAVGFNNHMGSLLTQHQLPMLWLMEVLEQHKLLFLDSRTTTETVAEQVARNHGIPSFRRDVFLDNERDKEAITRQFTQLIQRAKRNGFATGIGHPYPETLEVIDKMLPLLEKQGIELVNLSDSRYFSRTQSPQNNRSTVWQESSSPSRKVVKNLKP